MRERCFFISGNGSNSRLQEDSNCIILNISDYPNVTSMLLESPRVCKAWIFCNNSTVPSVISCCCERFTWHADARHATAAVLRVSAVRPALHGRNLPRQSIKKKAINGYYCLSVTVNYSIAYSTSKFTAHLLKKYNLPDIIIGSHLWSSPPELRGWSFLASSPRSRDKQRRPTNGSCFFPIHADNTLTKCSSSCPSASPKKKQKSTLKQDKFQFLIISHLARN